MTEPTDAEIWQLWIPIARKGVADPVGFARSVLEKWGTPPAVADEPWGACIGGRVWVGKLLPDIALRMAEAEGRPIQWLYTTPQPTQAQAVNQADRPFIVRLAEDFAEECVTAGYVTTKAASYGRLMDEALSTQAQAGAVPLTDEPDCGGESCDCRSYCKKKGGQHV